MIVISKRYMYKGKEVVVEDGDRMEQTWTVTVVDTGATIYCVHTSELSEKQ